MPEQHQGEQQQPSDGEEILEKERSDRTLVGFGFEEAGRPCDRDREPFSGSEHSTGRDGSLVPCRSRAGRSLLGALFSDVAFDGADFDPGRENDFRTGLIDGKTPFIAGDIPVEFVELVVKQQLVFASISDRVGVFTRFEFSVGATNPDSNSGPVFFHLMRFPFSVLRGVENLEGHLLPESPVSPIERWEVAKNPPLDLSTFGANDDGFPDLDGPILLDLDDRVEGENPFFRRERRRKTREDKETGEKQGQSFHETWQWSGGRNSLGDGRRHSLARVFDFEKTGGGELADPGNQLGGKRFDLVVPVADRTIVVASGILEGFLDLDEIAHELEKVFVGADLRVGLGDGDHLAEVAAEGGFGTARSGGGGSALRFVAFSNHRFEDFSLVIPDSLDGLDQRRDEFVTPFQLHIDSAPALAQLIAQSDEAVVSRDRPEEDSQRQDRGQEEECDGKGTHVSAG